MKRILAHYGNTPVEITNLVSDYDRKMVSVITTDGSHPFYHYCMGGGSYDDYTIVDFARLDNVRVESDPFEPVDLPTEDQEYDPQFEYFQMCEELRRGNA